MIYGETSEPLSERLIHVETIAARSRLHDGKIRPHRHRGLCHMLLIRSGQVAVRLDGQPGKHHAPLCVVVPPGVGHACEFRARTQRFIVSFDAGPARELSVTSPGILELVDRAAAAVRHRKSLRANDLWPLLDMLCREFGH